MPAGEEETIPGRGGERTALAAVLTAAGLAAIVVLVSLAAVLVSDSRWDAARVRASARAEQAAVQIGARVADAVAAMEAGRGETAELIPPDGMASVAVVDVDGNVRSGGQDAAALVADPAVRVAQSRARDSGELVLSAPTATDPPMGVLIRAEYRGDGGESTAERREQVSGYVFGILDTEAMIPPDQDSTLGVSDGGAVLAGSVADTDAATATVPVLDRRWQVLSPVASPSSAPMWFLAAAALAATVLLTFAARIWRGTFERSLVQAIDAREQAAAVLTYAGVMQESHELGEVVPALAVQLSDRLGLAGISFSVAGTGGRLREIFVHGDPPDRATAPRTAVPRSAGRDETVALHLRRAERSIGVLRIRCGRPLGPGEFDQVRIAGELVTSTVVTSRSLEQQQDAVDRLRTLDELKTAFLGTASHELRTPVTAISGFATMLSERWDTLSDESRRMFADRIASNARVLETLVQDLLDFARLERGDLALVLESVDVAVVTERVLDRLEPVWSSHTVERSITAESFVQGDVAALERVVTNLLSNAVKFSPSGSVVVVRVEHDDDAVRLVVEDEGPGVPAGERDRIFVRFFRGEGDAIMRTTGVGIGLSVVQDYVTRMGGRIEVERGARGGARFVIELGRSDRSPERGRQEEDSDVTT